MHEPNGNLWRATAEARAPAPPLEGAATADLAIVGGGFTGCSAALHAAEAGLSVRLLEAETIGHGGSGRNAGLVNAGLWTPPEGIAAILGAEEGARLTTALAGAPAA
ncbi:MAG: FAD-dependent oxidoreductase, partial [Pseudomonadota bacterium]